MDQKQTASDGRKARDRLKNLSSNTTHTENIHLEEECELLEAPWYLLQMAPANNGLGANPSYRGR